MRPLTLALLALCVAWALAGCQSDADRIREMNETERTRAQTPSSARTPTPTPTPLTAEIGVLEIEVGDCLNSTLPGGVTIETVVIVPCSGPWEYRVVSSFEVTGFDEYPGSDELSKLAGERCDRRFTYFLYPLEDSWEGASVLGFGQQDRAVDCLQASFGLSVGDRPRLDRMASTLRLEDGECFNEALETGGQQVEVVDCSGQWQYRVVDSFKVTGFDEYPGEEELAKLALRRCDRRLVEYYGPSADSWEAVQDRSLLCLQDSFGLPLSQRARLDRMAALSKLEEGECFKEAPETGGLQVEVLDCSGSGDGRVVTKLSVSGDGPYPGTDHFDGVAELHCAAATDFYVYPLEESWVLGDRTMLCIGAS